MSECWRQTGEKLIKYGDLRYVPRVTVLSWNPKKTWWMRACLLRRVNVELLYRPANLHWMGRIQYNTNVYLCFICIQFLMFKG